MNNAIIARFKSFRINGTIINKPIRKIKSKVLVVKNLRKVSR
jgi:hypothetical protein